jgi:hypothetical protein
MHSTIVFPITVSKTATTMVNSISIAIVGSALEHARDQVCLRQNEPGPPPPTHLFTVRC